MVFVLSGSGKIITEKTNTTFKAKDAILIDKNEKYYWNGVCKLVVVCSPTWTEKQHKTINN